MLTLSEQQVRQHLAIDEMLLALEQMFRRDYQKTAVLPQRTQMQIFAGTTCLIMPSSDRAIPGTGVKIVTVRDSAQADGDRVQASYFLLDETTARLAAFMAANYLTEMRTAAVSAIATKCLARPDAKVLGIFGTGRQAIAHLRLLTHTHRYERLIVSGSRWSRSLAFTTLAKTEYGLEVEAVDSRTCAQESDVICTCTTSKVPVFDGQLIREGTHLNLVGGFQPDGREVDDFVISRSRIVVDTFEGALAEAGDLLIPLHTKTIDNEKIVCDLHQVVSGKAIVRRDRSEITLFKSVGFALEDLVVANLLYERLRLHEVSAVEDN